MRSGVVSEMRSSPDQVAVTSPVIMPVEPSRLRDGNSVVNAMRRPSDATRSGDAHETTPAPPLGKTSRHRSPYT